MERGTAVCLELLRDALRERIVPATTGGVARQSAQMATGILTRLSLAAGLGADLERRAFHERRTLLAEYAPYLDGADRDDAERLIGVPADAAPDADLASVRRLLERVHGMLLNSDTREAQQAARRILSIDARNRRALEDAFKHAMTQSTDTQANAVPSSLTADETARLAAWLRREFPDEGSLEITGSRAIPGGFSRQTLFVEMRGTKRLPPTVVVRRDGLVLHSGKSVGFEYPILQALAASGTPAPAPLACETTGTVLGRPFLVVSRVEGDTFGDTIDVSGGPDRTLGHDLATVLAKLHAVPIGSLTHVDGAGMKPVDRIRREIAADHAAWKSLGFPSLPMDAAFAWLARHMDAADGPLALVHRDIGGHNLLAKDHRIQAILDWEIAVIGNPAEDLGYARFTVEQLVDWPSFMDAYAARSGWRPSDASIDFYTLWGAARLVVLIGKARAGVLSGQLKDLGLAYVGEHFMPRFASRVADTVERLLA